MSEKSQFYEGCGCAMMMIAAAVSLIIVIWAGKGFPHFWS